VLRGSMRLIAFALLKLCCVFVCICCLLAVCYMARLSRVTWEYAVDSICTFDMVLCFCMHLFADSLLSGWLEVVTCYVGVCGG